jgi:hypothetical protein
MKKNTIQSRTIHHDPKGNAYHLAIIVQVKARRFSNNYCVFYMHIIEY